MTNCATIDGVPDIPPSVSLEDYLSTPRWDKVIPDTGEVLFGPDAVSPESLLFGPLTVPASVIGYLLAGDKGTEKVAQEVRSWAARLDTEKISKQDAYYFPQTPIPFGVWEYKCETCRFYQPDGDGDGSPKCSLVGQEGDPIGGDGVHPDAWCALWLPEDGRKWFEYVTERLEGEG